MPGETSVDENQADGHVVYFAATQLADYEEMIREFSFNLYKGSHHQATMITL